MEHFSGADDLSLESVLNDLSVKKKNWILKFKSMAVLERQALLLASDSVKEELE